MKKIIFTLIASLAALPLSAQSGIESKINKGDAVPHFSVEMVDGTTVNIADLKGKVVLLNFWATWCPPCRAELSVIQKELIDRIDSDDFVLLAVSRGEALEKVLKFREQNGYTFPMGIDPGTLIFPLFAESGIPRNYLIDRNGVVVDVIVGFEAKEENPFGEIIEKVEKLLK